MTWTLVDGAVNFHLRFSKVILTAPPLLPRKQREGPQPSGAVMGRMCVERTMPTMGGMIDVISAVSAVQRSPSRAPPESRAGTSDGVLASLRIIRQHRRGWAEGL